MALMASSMASSYTLRMFWYHVSIFCYAELVLGLYIHEPAIFPIMWPSAFLVGGVKEPSM